ncbi:uncharacterized protein LOC135359057 [Latimeria chalumnae]|uniref:uncharacterized protein LOC135359057 n=1 Tax=Latimeria chalumnae TaxID=7897 RepID=UPI00313DEC7F
MSLGKLPVIKSLVAGSHGKRRVKSELTPDMISPPLDDFRHTMHVGRGGDVFGDTSFLSNHGGEAEPAKTNIFLRTLRHVKKSPGRSRDVSSPPPPVSPIIKNAISLPHLADTPNGPSEKVTFKSVQSSPRDMNNSYGLESGFCTIPRFSRLEKLRESLVSADPKPELQRSDSMRSFKVDLGPSLMSEVMDIINFSDFQSWQESEGSAMELPSEESFLKVGSSADLKEAWHKNSFESQNGCLDSTKEEGISGLDRQSPKLLTEGTGGEMDPFGNLSGQRLNDVGPARLNASNKDSNGEELRSDGGQNGSQALAKPRLNGITSSVSPTEEFRMETYVSKFHMQPRLAPDFSPGRSDQRSTVQARDLNQAAKALACHYGGAVLSPASKDQHCQVGGADALRPQGNPLASASSPPAKGASSGLQASAASSGRLLTFAGCPSMEPAQDLGPAAAAAEELLASEESNFTPVRSGSFTYVDEEDEVKV